MGLFSGPDTILHKFPDPEKELNRYNMWIYAIGGNVLVIDPKSVFKNGRVCHSHFDPKFSTASKRLSKNAVPSLFLSGINLCNMKLFLDLLLPDVDTR